MGMPSWGWRRVYSADVVLSGMPSYVVWASTRPFHVSYEWGIALLEEATSACQKSASTTNAFDDMYR